MARPQIMYTRSGAIRFSCTRVTSPAGVKSDRLRANCGECGSEAVTCAAEWFRINGGRRAADEGEKHYLLS